MTDRHRHTRLGELKPSGQVQHELSVPGLSAAGTSEGILGTALDLPAAPEAGSVCSLTPEQSATCWLLSQGLLGR